MEKPDSPEEFEESLNLKQPPTNWPETVLALWWDAKGDWGKAHEYADSLSTPISRWIHAYLHRKEGDLWNADYWYAKAGKSRPSKSLDKEFGEILSEILNL